MSILDVNDNAPVLSDNVYDLIIEEDEAVGSIIDISISYSDADSGSNAMSTYSINTGKY